MMGYVNKSLKLSALCVAIACVQTNALALENLEKLDDYQLADSTGEGIALLPENFSMRMNGTDTTNSGEGTYGAGYMRLIPVGTVSQEMKDKGYDKADIYINGVSLAQSKKDYGVARTGDDWGVPFGAITATGGTPATTDFGRDITSWGTADNPWVFKTLTETVPNFVGTPSSVPYMTFEAPLMHSTIPTTGKQSSAYNLKLGMYVDAFKRNSAVPENGYNGLSDRLRLAVVWDGFSINGSNLKVFRTLGGVTDTMGGTYNAELKVNNNMETHTFNYGLNTSYNETFGFAGLVRLNSGYTNTSRATIDFTGTATRNIYQLNVQRATPGNVNTKVLRDDAGNILWVQGADVTANPNTDSGILLTYQPPTTDMKKSDVFNGIPSNGSYPSLGMCKNSGYNISNTDSANNMQCYNREGITARRFVVTQKNTWTPPTIKSVLRISTQELLNSMPTGAGVNGTPALGGADGYIPNFKPNSTSDGVFLYDMNINLVLGSLYQPVVLGSDGDNFSFEVTRIPNNSNVYEKIYQKYSDTDAGATGNYLGNTCNIHKCGGTVTVNGTQYQDSQATHSSISIGSTEYDAGSNRLTAHNSVRAYGVSIGELKTQSGLDSDNTQDFTQVWKSTRSTSGSSGWGTWNTWSAVAPKAATSVNPNAYESVYRQNSNGQILGIQTTMPTLGNTNLAPAAQVAPNTYLNNMSAPGKTVGNNFGSVAIDGLLIQHLKFTTTGL